MMNRCYKNHRKTLKRRDWGIEICSGPFSYTEKAKNRQEKGSN